MSDFEPLTTVESCASETRGSSDNSTLPARVGLRSASRKFAEWLASRPLLFGQVELLSRWTAICCVVGLSVTVATKLVWASQAAGWAGLGARYTAWLWGWDIALFCGLIALSAAFEHRWRVASWFFLPLCVGVTFLSLINAFWLDGTGSQLAASVFTLGLGRADQNLAIAVEKVGPVNVVVFVLLNVGLPLALGALLGPLRQALRSPKTPRRALAPVFPLAVGLGACLFMFSTPRHPSPSVRSVARNVHFDMLSEAWHISKERLALGEKQLNLPIVPRQQLKDQAGRGHRNVVFVLLESANYLKSSFGEPEANRTPNLKRLSKLGLFASSMRTVMPHSSKALFSIHCGAYPDMQRAVMEAADSFPSNCLPRVLSGLGYATAFFQSANGAFEMRPRMVHRMGFEEYFPRELLHAEWTTVINGDDFAMLRPGLDWIRQQRDAGKPFFATFFTSLQHVNYTFPPRMKKKRCVGSKRDCERQRYEEVYKEATDAFLGELVEGLEDEGLMENTVLIATGDHGEGHGEHGLYVHDNVYFEEGLHVPTVVLAPGLVQPGSVNEEHRSLIDLFPTTLDLLGIRFHRNSVDGYSLLSSQPANEKRYFRCWYDEYCQGYVEGVNKIVSVPREDTYFRFDIVKDPEEIAPVEEEPRLVTEIDALSEWMASRKNLIRDLKYEPKRLFEVWDCQDSRGRCTLDPEAYSEYMKKRFEVRDGQGLVGAYFSDENFGKVAFERLDPLIDFNWPRKTSPGQAIPMEKYSIRWNGCIEVLPGETPRLAIGSDDGTKVWIGDRLFIDNGGKHTYRWGFASRLLTEGIHKIRIEYIQDTRDAQVTLGWLTEKEQDLPTVVPPLRLMPPGDSPDARCPVINR